MLLNLKRSMSECMRELKSVSSTIETILALISQGRVVAVVAHGGLNAALIYPLRMSDSEDSGNCDCMDCDSGLPHPVTGTVGYDGVFTPTMTTGVKGSDVYTDGGVGDPRVALSTKLVRGADVSTVQKGFAEILARHTSEFYNDAAALAFQTRDVRGGKGERKLFHIMLQEVYKQQPELAMSLAELIPEYGSWDDVFTVAAEAPAPFKEALLKIAAAQLKRDEAALRGKGKGVSLLAKWAPREGKHFNKIAQEFSTLLAGGSAGVPLRDASGNILKHSQLMASYRKRLTALNKHIDTVEIKECSKHWADIDPKRVPARAREMKKAAYLNEMVVRGQRSHRAPPPSARHPNDPDRVACREHFQAFFQRAARGEVKISGADTLYPHEIVTKAEGLGQFATEDDKNSLNAVWTQMVAKAAAGGGLGKSLFMCDFSGSMAGTPMQVAKAMGLLGSAVCSGPLKGKFLTFNTTPEWCEINTEATLFEQLKQLNFNWGGSTDIQKAGEMIIAELKAARAPPGSAPENIIIVTDMGFDAACGSASRSIYTGNSYRHNVKTAAQQTHAQLLRENFRRASEDVHGDPNAWAAPRIVVWNVADHYSGNHQATAHEEGVVTLSGWSPSLFKILCEEGPRVMTAYDALRVQLDDKRYDPVRAKVAEWLAGGWRGL